MKSVSLKTRLSNVPTLHLSTLKATATAALKSFASTVFQQHWSAYSFNDEIKRSISLFGGWVDLCCHFRGYDSYGIECSRNALVLRLGKPIITVMLSRAWKAKHEAAARRYNIAPPVKLPRVCALATTQGAVWEAFIKAMRSGEKVEIDEEMYFHWLEVLPPVWMNRTVTIDGLRRRCKFGFAEGAEHIIAFYTEADKRKGQRYFCQRTNEINRG